MEGRVLLLARHRHLRAHLLALPGRRPALLHQRRRPDLGLRLHVGRVRAPHQRSVSNLSIARSMTPDLRSDPGEPEDIDRFLTPSRPVLRPSEPYSPPEGGGASARPQRLVGEANKYVTDTEPFKLKAPGAVRAPRRFCGPWLRRSRDLNLILSPFLPRGQRRRPCQRGAGSEIAPMPYREVAELDPQSPAD